MANLYETQWSIYSDFRPLFADQTFHLPCKMSQRVISCFMPSFNIVFRKGYVSQSYHYSRGVCSSHKRLFCSSSSFKFKSKCWKCKKDIVLTFGQFACDCGVLQPPSKNANYFEVLGRTSQYSLNTDDLARTFKKLQSLLHPDKFSSKSEVKTVINHM